MTSKNGKHYRLMRGMSQEALAQQIGPNKMAVSKDEIGRRTPNLVTIRKIADALQVTIGKLTVSYGNELVIEHGAFRKHSIISGARI